MVILHIDFNSFFASVEQQANPRLRGKPIGVTGGDRETRTVLSTASIEAKKLGVKTGMPLWEARKICPNLIVVAGDSDKYLSVTTKFLNILKSYSPNLEVFSIDEAFLELVGGSVNQYIGESDALKHRYTDALGVAQQIKQRIKTEIGEYITCSIGISYNKLMAKLAGSLKKPDGLVVISDQEAAIKVLDSVELDDICGIGSRIKSRLFNLGVRDFKTLRSVPKELLLASFKSYGEVLYNMARGIDFTPIKPFFDREEVKSIGHRHTTDHDTSDLDEIKQILLKMSEMVAIRLRNKKLVGKTIHLWYRSSSFEGNGKQETSVRFTSDGLEIFKVAWEIFLEIWDRGNLPAGRQEIRMIGVSISNLKSARPANLSLLPEDIRQETILKAIDKINSKFGDFTLQRGALLDSCSIKRKPNPFLSDRRFKI